MDMSSGKLWEMVRDREDGVLKSMGPQSVWHDLSMEEQQVPFLWGIQTEERTNQR